MAKGGLKMKKIFIAVGFSFVIALVFGGQYLKDQGSIWLPGSGGNFTLQSNKGAVSLSDYKGKVVALYFGYMSCADICPTSLWNLTTAINLLTPEQAEQIQGIFVSLDPDRDSPKAMDLYVKGFKKSFVGLVDSKEKLDAVARQYGVVYEKVELKGSAMGYVLDHTSVIYLMDKKGKIQYRIPHNTDPEIMKQELLKLL